MNEKEIKLELLRSLMAEMDSRMGSKFKKKPMVEVTEVKSEEMPVEELLEKIVEDKKEEPEEENEDGEMCPDCRKMKCDCPLDESSGILRKLKELKARK